MEEIWKDIEGYEGLYMISSHGRVWSCRSKKILKNILSRRGYLKVTLCNEYRKEHTIHRLVGLNFILKTTGKDIINHIDENKLNNQVDNLEWCTVKENTNHGTCLNRRSKKRSIKIIGVNMLTREHMKFDSLTDATYHGFTSSNISKCIKGERKTHKGYKWYRQSDFEQKEHKQCI